MRGARPRAARPTTSPERDDDTSLRDGSRNVFFMGRRGGRCRKAVRQQAEDAQRAQELHFVNRTRTFDAKPWARNWAASTRTGRHARNNVSGRFFRSSRTVEVLQS